MKLEDKLKADIEHVKQIYNISDNIQAKKILGYIDRDKLSRSEFNKIYMLKGDK